MNPTIKCFFLLVISFTVSCSVKTINVSKKPSLNKSSTEARSNLSKQANQLFWQALHSGSYEDLPKVIRVLTAAYLEDPNDTETVVHLGFSHIWALSERGRLAEIEPTITDHATLSLKYFGEAYQLNPKDPRVLGFLADLKMTVGNISQDEGLRREGYFDGLASIGKWKEFNYFTIGYVLSSLPHDSWQFQNALAWQWKTIESCLDGKFDLNEAAYTEDHLSLQLNEKDPKKVRACWNTWIAPHNFEGFFLNLGDMLVKNGETSKAIKAYSIAQKAPTYREWPYKEILEARMKRAKENVSKFRAAFDGSRSYPVSEVMLINSSISCVVCHQKSESELLRDRDFDFASYKKDQDIYWLQQ